MSGLRYGAFNALRTLSGDDELLGRVRVLNPPEEPDDEETDSMSAAITTRRDVGRAVEDPFKLYLVDSEGPPLIHIARTHRCEIVVFGQNTKLLPPIVLGKGSIFLNASDGDEKIEISKIVPSRTGEGDQKVYSSLNLGDVIRQGPTLARVPNWSASSRTPTSKRTSPARWWSTPFRAQPGLRQGGNLWRRHDGQERRRPEEGRHVQGREAQPLQSPRPSPQAPRSKRGRRPQVRRGDSSENSSQAA